MNNGSLKPFIDDINDVREYIKYISLVNNIEISSRDSDDEAISEFREHLHSFRVSKKTFEYKAITISLYGILEKHVALWVKEFASHLPKIISNFGDLPEKLREDHFNLSVKLLSLVGERKYSKYENIKRESVLAKLSSCIDNSPNFELNGEAFCLHSGNLKHSKISNILDNLDIKLTATLKAIGLRQGGFLCQGLSGIASKGDELFKLIDELVDRRNDIAHGEDIVNLLNVTEFDDYVNFLENYGRAVFQTLLERITQFEADFLYNKIDKIKGIFKDGSILCFEIENIVICKGDNIIVKLSDGGFIKKEILEIQKDNRNFDKLVVTTPENIGVNLESGLSNGQTFFIHKRQ
jgi:hypothetical protein